MVPIWNFQTVSGRGILRSSQARSSTKFALLRGVATPLRRFSGGRHRRGVGQQQFLLRGQDHRRVHALHPPKLRRPPLVDRLLYSRRLDHQLAGVDKLAQLPLLLEGRLQLEWLHPIEGGPNGSTLDAALLLDELPELSPAASAQGLLLRSHEQPSLPL